MSKNVCSPENIHPCTGCGMCASVCPVGAVTVKEGDDGFYRPLINEDKCTSCSLCTKLCYRFDEEFVVKEEEKHECFSAVNKDEDELKSASSGAVSIELMRECLRRGYIVVGAAYDVNTERAVTITAKSDGELERFKGSKYFQSYTADAFREIVCDKSEQKYAVFGTPCQIYALAKLAQMKKNRDRFILVDIFCHGCPSLKLWDKYLAYVKEKTGEAEFDKINFRSKSHGWHEYSFDFIKGNRRITSSKYDDPFHELFFGMDAMNEACYDCIARSSVEMTDLRIGDFWGKRHDMDTKGVSAVVISSEKGKELFDAVASKFHTESADFDEIIGAQSYKKTHTLNSDRRKKLLEWLKGSDDIVTIVKKRRKMVSFKTNVKRSVKSTLKHLPSPIYLKLKTKLR